MKIVWKGIAGENMYDESGHFVIQGSSSIEGQYLEYQDTRRHVRAYKKMGREILLLVQHDISFCGTILTNFSQCELTLQLSTTLSS